MNPLMHSAVVDLLNSHHIAFNVIEIPMSEDKKPIRNLEELLISNHLDPKSVVRSILFRGESGQFVLLAVAGGGRADWGILRKHLNEKKCRMAEYEEVHQTTGYVVGAVPPIALPAEVRILVDNSVKTYENVVIGSGVLGYALALKGSDLLKLMATAEFEHFAKD